MRMIKFKCHKCKKPTDRNDKICYNCGAILINKENIFSKEELKKTKLIE